MLWWAQYYFHKKHARTTYAELVFLHPVGSMGHVVHFQCVLGAKHRHTIFHARVGPVLFQQKARRDTLR
jgi:hypothetical protein